MLATLERTQDQFLQHSSQAPVTPVPATPSSGSCRHYTFMWHAFIHVGKTPKYIKQHKTSKKKILAT